MASRAEIAARLIDLGIVAVVRTPKFEQVRPVCAALVEGGVLGLEITLTVPNALQALREVSERFGARAIVGAGTVLNAVQAREAIAAGAQFVVSPITNLEIIPAAHSLDKPVM